MRECHLVLCKTISSGRDDSAPIELRRRNLPTSRLSRAVGVCFEQRRFSGGLLAMSNKLRRPFEVRKRD